MNKRIAISALTVSVLIFIIYGFYLYNLPHLDVLNQKAALNVTSVDLYNDFSKSESAANFKYLNKIILVNGEVSEIKHLNNSFMVELTSRDNKEAINCLLSDSDSANIRLIKTGEVVSIKGKCIGYLSDVEMVDCILIK